MPSGNLQFGNNGVGNNAGGDQTTITSMVPVNSTGIPTATFMASNTGSGPAVLGETSNSAAAVLGVSNGDGPGIAGSNAFAGSGVRGDSETGAGVVGTSVGGLGSAAVSGENNGFGAGVRGFSLNGYGGVFIGPAANGAPPAASGGLLVVGEILKTGGEYSEGLPHPDGSMRRMYAPLSPESFYEDFGRGELIEGHCRVRLDPDFAALLGIEDGAFHVFLTPEGDSKGLFVDGRDSTGFDVREQENGSSSLTFSYRVVALRSAHRRERMAALVEQEGLLRATSSSLTSLPRGDQL